MNFTKINIMLAILLLIVATLAAAIDVDYSRPNVEFLPEMKYSPAWSAYAANPNFANGRTLQIPVKGTIARGELPLHYAATKEDAERAGRELQNPFMVAAELSGSQAPTGSVGNQLTAQLNEAGAGDQQQQVPNAQLKRETEARERLRVSLGRGAQIYSVFCVSCHGVGGAGDGPVAKRGFPPPPPLTTGKSVQMKDGQLFHILTYGQGNMAPMAAQLPRERRWEVINYVRGLQQSAAEAATQVQSEPAVSTATPPDQPTGQSGPEEGNR